MGMNRKAIETISVNAVRDSIVMSDYLDQFIPDNDKEPFWDGSVYIYKNKEHKKENFTGRMPVQVKGTECKDLSKAEISFSVDLVDLKGYLAEGGTVFFVVYIANKGLLKKIYYNALTPIKIRMILESAKGQKTKAIKFNEFPTDNDEKANVFFGCYQNCQMQTSFSDAKLFSLEELRKEVDIESLTIPLSGVRINKDPQMALVKNEVYVYANVKGSSIPQPLNFIPQNLHTSQDVTTRITINGKLFYSKVTIIKSAKSIEYKIGESLKLTTINGTDELKINYTSSDEIQTLAQDLDFMLSYIEAGYFESEGHKFPFNFDSADFSNFDIEEQKKILKAAKRADETLKILGCKKPLLIKELTDADWRNIERLHTAFIDNKPAEGLKENLPPVCMMKIGNLNVVLTLIKQEDNKNAYEIKDFFATEMLAVYQSGEDEQRPISQYAVLTAEDLIKADNVKCDVFLPSFQKVEKHEGTFERANWFLLDLITVYDKTGNKEFLNTAKDFAEWISTSTDDEMPYHIKTLNLLQVIKRTRKLNEEEIKTLYKIAAEKDVQDSTMVGVYLLLDQQVPAEMFFAKMDPNEQTEFMKYPIYHFWKKDEDAKNG